MDCLWEGGGKKVSDVLKCLKKKRQVAYTTVMTVMTRLTKKGFLTREKHGRAFLYFPKKTKEQTAKNAVKRILNSLVDQFGQEAVSAFSDELKKYK